MLSHKKICTDLKCILLREKSPSEKPAYSMTPIIHHSVRDKTMETVSGGPGLGGETVFLEQSNYSV